MLVSVTYQQAQWQEKRQEQRQEQQRAPEWQQSPSWLPQSQQWRQQRWQQPG
jgi:hypothetical protein